MRQEARVGGQNDVRPKRRLTNAHKNAHTEMLQVVAALEQLVAERRQAQAVARHSGRPLGDLLVARGNMVAAELEAALRQQSGTGRRLGEIVVELGLVPEAVVVELLAEQFHIEVLDPTRMSVDLEVAFLLSELDACRFSAVPIRRTAAGIAIAISDPARPNLVAELNRRVPGPIRLYLTTNAVIERLIDVVHPRPAPIHQS
jgi:hypothetical protein